MSPEWHEHHARLRPEILAQKARLQNTVANAMAAYRRGGNVSTYVEALSIGETHPVLDLQVGRDFLTDALVAAWEVCAQGRTVEMVVEDVSSRLGDDLMPLPVTVSDIPKALALLPYVSSLAAAILMWDDGRSPSEQEEMLRSWSRLPDESMPEEIFEAFSEAHDIPVEVSIRAGLSVLAWLEHLTVSDLDFSALLDGDA